MPGMVLFGRRWAIASDDLVFPGVFELFVRVLWWIGILTLYLMHRGKLDCPGGVLLSSYLIVLIILLAVIICTVSAIVCVSMKGTICNPGPRKSMSKLLYVRLALFLPEMVWASLGAAWIEDGVQCDRTVGNGIIATVAVRTRTWCPATLQQGSLSSTSNRTASGTTRSLTRWSAIPQGPPSCRSRTTDYDLVGGDQLNCHFGSILQTTGLQYRDFIHVSFHDKVYELPFLVALDHRKESVVVAVRGTMSLQDILTDLSAESEPVDLECEVQDCWAHKGISQAARYVYRRLINDGILSQAFSIAPEYRLVIVGHSLGAGAAALLTIMLRSPYPRVRCYAFSPPRGLLSKSLYEYSKTFIVSLVLGKDVIPRLSVTNLEDLKRRILRVIAYCNKPKYKILLRACWYELFGGHPEDLPTELDGGDLTQPLLGERSLLAHGSPAYSFSSDSPLESPTKYPPLYPPGRIIHLEEVGTSGRFSCYPAARYSVKWSHESEFSKILIGPKMLTDHMPDILMRALDSVVSDRAACVSCPTQGGSSVEVA
ncbi:sn1-specific diacylglycerol lipase beta isoform X2 [Neophocaena asiaeorientalis asiaeorientalis]|uniref:Diacylglycerol lipase-beta n=1 Tax=Neophocaena asiaeorientalis asiaeorientalis TaxID=1706337 RepID=A0A341BH45_NEOAA|nr:sn1-specific diacylglycerol lipase beta isoform X2 [Neophocaena asiaeorientalis asiaeorientalis]